MARQTASRKESLLTMTWYKPVLVVITIMIVVAIVAMLHPKEKFRSLIKDNQKRDELKKECKSKGGNWKRGGDMISDYIWGYNRSCIKYDIDSKVVGGYCCHETVNPYNTGAGNARTRV